MGRKVGAWERAGRPLLRSPGRPPVGRLEHRQRFWAAIARGASSEAAAAEAGVSGPVGVRWFRDGGGMPTVTLAAPSGRYLSFAEREEIALLRVGGCGVREVARRLGRSPSTISRELRRNAATRGGRLDYRATTAQWHADVAHAGPSRPGSPSTMSCAAMCRTGWLVWSKDPMASRWAVPTSGGSGGVGVAAGIAAGRGRGVRSG